MAAITFTHAVSAASRVLTRAPTPAVRQAPQALVQAVKPKPMMPANIANRQAPVSESAASKSRSLIQGFSAKAFQGGPNANFKIRSQSKMEDIRTSQSEPRHPIQQQSREQQLAGYKHSEDAKARVTGQNKEAEAKKAHANAGLDPDVEAIKGKGDMAGGAIQGAGALNDMHASSQKKTMQQQQQTAMAQAKSQSNQLNMEAKKLSSIGDIASNVKFST